MSPDQGANRIKDVNTQSYEAAAGLVTLPNLSTLDIDGVRLDESFYRGMASGASGSKV